MPSAATAAFLPPELYSSEAVAALEREHVASRFWHPIAAAADLPPGHVRAVELLGLPVLLCRDTDGILRAFRNRCPHRAVAFREPAEGTVACRRLVCPYHGWTYDLGGTLLAAARESEFVEPFDREAWPLEALGCQVRASLIWVALGADPIPLDDQLDLPLQEAAVALALPRVSLAFHRQTLACNWKIAHDNTLDDYHVAIAHPTTLHRMQGPVRHYSHRFGTWANVLATPWLQGEAEFLTFGLPPWNHLLLWPDGRLALIQFLPNHLDSCTMQVWLLGPQERQGEGQALMAEMVQFLAEDRALVESAQRGYGEGFRTGPPHRLEARILHQQAIYAALLEPWYASGRMPR
ncbi:aromatic ring-hydroxylating dioxygenase subunit alpha [Cyanobium gracile]|uniref:Aromatic ring-hydroxylating dioxygenase subunit alpha n=1 Tax=Cyanobium gracile UHCC 0281 TaxID=3110309 RepID=A0ABU5SSP7_9CYAN|nr:aromatic ring-hydroxylating dioxygenase subunit alpha [Cyanobium gracile]MEA5441495.1 aromatic ring-hydroxylating dioxygenase subunit alpha [Cyanobium gracile UHCC 0281]